MYNISIFTKKNLQLFETVERISLLFCQFTFQTRNKLLINFKTLDDEN